LTCFPHLPIIAQKSFEEKSCAAVEKVGSPSLVFFLFFKSSINCTALWQQKCFGGIMKKFAVLVSLFALVASAAFAATDTLTLNGKVAEKLQIAFAESGPITFNLTEAGVGTISTGDIELYSNRKAYVIKISSANSWKLVSGDTLDINYSVKVDDGTTDPIVWTDITNNLSSYGTPAALTNIITATDYRTQKATFKLTFQTSPTANTFYDFDQTYTDTITLTISAT
jgi:hypothetical protein